MSSIDNTQVAIEKSQQNVEKTPANPIVDLSDAQSVRQVFGTAHENKDRAISEDGHITFSDPFKEAGHREGHGNKDLGDQLNTNTTAPTTPTAGSDSAPVTAANGAATAEQQLLTGILQVEEGMVQVVAELAQLFELTQNPQPIDGTSPVVTTTTPTDGSSTSTTTTPTDGSSTSTTTTPTDGSSTSTTTTTSTDTTTPIADPAAKPTSSDPFIADLQWSDPALAKTVQDASKTMSAAGYAKFESQLDTSYTGGKNDFNGTTNFKSGNANFNDSLMQHALSGDGLSTADKTALTSVLQSDMPSALASDSFVSSIQQSSPEMAKALTTASGVLSKSDYSTLEGYLEQFHTTSPDGSGALPNQLYLDSVSMNHAVGGMSAAGQKTMESILQTDMPSAASSDTLAATLQQQDAPLAKVLASAKTSMSSAGYSDLENYVAENSTWNTANDASLMNQAMTQSGQTSTDAAALKSDLQANMSDALTATPSAAVQKEMDLAKESYMQAYALEGTNVGDIAGNPGKSGTGWTDSDQMPYNASSELPWTAIAPLNENNYNANATVQVDDTAVYLHLKTGGWVESTSPSDDTYWEAVYANSNNASSAGNGKVNSDGSYSFSAPAEGTNIQMGTQHNTLDPSLYDGVYETMQAKTDVANSGLGMNLSGDYFLSSLSNGQIRPGAGESNWVPLTNTYQSLYYTTLSAAEMQADPPPGL